MVTKKEMETFLSKNLKPNKDKDNGKFTQGEFGVLFDDDTCSVFDDINHTLGTFKVTSDDFSVTLTN